MVEFERLNRTGFGAPPLYSGYAFALAIQLMAISAFSLLWLSGATLIRHFIVAIGSLTTIALAGCAQTGVALLKEVVVRDIAPVVRAAPIRMALDTRTVALGLRGLHA